MSIGKAILFRCIMVSLSKYILLCRIVADTLATIEADRKCYRLIGGVLVERTVKEVLPALMENSENVRLLIYFN